MFAWLKRLFRGKPAAKKTGGFRLRSRYDAAEDREDNRRHWLNADNLSADGANSPSVRKTLRERARYEFANNSYCNGILTSLANDLVGVGPTLQVQIDDANARRQIETAFWEWAEAVRLAEKLRTLKLAKTRDGEGLALLVTNDALPTSVKLDVQPFETDRLTTPDPLFKPPDGFYWVDGIVFDSAGNPVEYHILRVHPGDAFFFTNDYDRVPARSVLHWYRVDRPGQSRGIPEITPALPLFAQLRRYTLAVLSAAEAVAEMGAILLESTANPDDETEEPEPFDKLELERGMMTTLPAGMKASQMRPEQPATTYGDFKNHLLREIGRCLGTTFNVVSGDSSSYNYSSARLDHLLYRSLLNVERDHCRCRVLEPIFRAWLDEAANIPGLLPRGVSIGNLPHSWYWPGFATIDPIKEAKGNTEALANHTTTLAELLAAEGLDWEEVLEQRAREIQRMRELGLTPAEPISDTSALDTEEANRAG
ncbi:MAG: phage portal protein [Gemmatales bacterium]|nr:MAG: phage portal protein [Gemmatales bacterium]